MNAPRVLIVAAEESSALYAQRLLEHWKNEKRQVSTFGVGSQKMVDLGFDAIGRSEEMAVVGIQEVLSNYGLIRSCFYKILEVCRTDPPDVVLLLDYPDFNLRLAKKLKKQGLSILYYISPQIWAWRSSRIHLIKKVVDKTLVVFPFEKDFYEKFDHPVEFVGHPLLDELDRNLPQKEERIELRSRYGIRENDLVLGLMPGSRRSELAHNLETQLKTAEALSLKFSQLKVALFVSPNFSIEEVRESLPAVRMSLILVKDSPFRMIALADLILCASGTATLMVGLAQVPLVIMYKMKAFTAFLAKKLVKQTSHFGLINLVMGREVAPEFFQEAASVEQLSAELEKLILDPEKRLHMTNELLEARTRLGDRGATQKVARVVESYFRGSSL